MAGTVMHLVIADKLMDYLKIDNPALFFCGNLAPDAIMARENYQREMKRHTHFKDGTSLHEFRIPEKRAEYDKRFQAFFEKYVLPEGPMQELYFGYTTHMIVDELYIVDFRDRFVDELVRQGKAPNDKEFFHLFTKDVDQIDWELVRTYPFRFEMPETILQESNYEIPGYITNAEILDSKDFIIHKNFLTEHEKEDLKVMTLEENLKFIDLCVERIPMILRERFGGMKCND